MSYDVEAFVQQLVVRGVEMVIPPRANRKEQRPYDRHWYKEGHLVECFINKNKYYRRILSRFEKYASRYLGFLSFVGALIWLRCNVNTSWQEFLDQIVFSIASF